MEEEASRLLHQPIEYDDSSRIFSARSNLGDHVGVIGEERPTKSSCYMFLLTLGIFGQQMGWALEMTNGSPYLLSLGLNKALLAFVWLAGPLSGTIMQPYIGLKSDRCRSKYGRRRPYIVAGAFLTVFSLIALAWAREIVTTFLSVFGFEAESEAVQIILALFAVLSFYALDFAINILQAAQRAYAVDCTPHHQQETVNAWIARVSSLGNILGMFFGSINLPKVFPYLGNSQFKVLCALASMSIFITGFISIGSILEPEAHYGRGIEDSKDGIVSMFRDLWQAIFHLPRQIKRICEVEFFAWIGWFPVLFYTTTYVAEIYTDPFFEKNLNMSNEEIDMLWEEGARRGSTALLMFAIVTLLSSILIPFAVPPIFIATESLREPGTPLARRTSASSHQLRPQSKWKIMYLRLILKSALLLNRLQIPSLTLRKVWIFSHVLFFVLMCGIFVTKSVTGASVLIGLIGIPWAVTIWAPHALVSAEVSKRDAIRRGIIRPRHADEVMNFDGDDDDGGTSADQAGIVMGIHNVSISAPQVVASLLGSLLFQLLQKPRGVPGDISIAVFFFVGGLCTLVAAYWAWKVVEEIDEN